MRAVQEKHLPLLRERMRRPCSEENRQEARKRLLDHFFWDLIFWSVPELNDELTEGEYLHPAIFAR